MTDLHDDIRDLLARHARDDVRPDVDRAWAQLADRIEPGRAAGRASTASAFRRAPFALVAAALALLLGVGLVVAGTTGDDTGTDNVAGPGPDATTDTTEPATPTRVHDLHAVWPTDSSAELRDYARLHALIDPVSAAREYIAARTGLSEHTTFSEFRSGDGESGEVVVGGDVSTIVSLRRLAGDGTPWYVVAAVSELMPAMEGDVVPQRTRIYVEAGGDLLIRRPNDIGNEDRHIDSPTEIAVDGHAWFILATPDGTVALTEVRDAAAATVP